jgi:hypothetical protein
MESNRSPAACRCPWGAPAGTANMQRQQSSISWSVTSASDVRGNTACMHLGELPMVYCCPPPSSMQVLPLCAYNWSSVSP